MATVPPDRNPGDSGHIADHLLINDAIEEFETETVAMQAQIAALQAQNSPTIKGTVNSEANLPLTGIAGEMYLIADTADLFSWVNNAWAWVGNLKGERGNNGAPGTIVGVLAPGEDPPVSAEYGSLWFIAGSAPPPSSAAPMYVTGSSAQAGTRSLSVSIPSVLDGDLGLLCVSYDPVIAAGSGVPLTPSGWTLVNTYASGNADHSLRLYTRSMLSSDNEVALAIEPVAYPKMAAALMVFRNVSTTLGDVQFVATSDNTVTAPSVTATAGGAVCGFHATRISYATSGDSQTVARPSTFTDGPDALVASGGGCSNIASGYDLSISAGTVAPGDWVRTSTVPAGSSPCALTIALAAA